MKTTKEEFRLAYRDLHSGKTGETLASNADRLFDWLQKQEELPCPKCGAPLRRASIAHPIYQCDKCHTDWQIERGRMVPF